KPALRKSAIKRVYDAALAEAGFGVVVVDVVEDKKLGLVAVIGDESGGDMPSDADITAVLGGFIYPWRI
ncbi:MAG: acyl-CoA synthetase, partial [Proteobacteria bacterium]|nr:acyl-CoA synthetase [Pseudomonadota bacterium]